MTAAPYQIRPATLADAEAIAGLLSELGYPSDPTRARRSVSAALNDPQQALIVVASIDGVHGLAAVTELFYFHLGQRIARLASLVVHSAARGQGLGSLLLRAAEQWAAARGCSHIELTSSGKRERAHAFYLREGYDQSSYRFVRSLPDAE